MSFCSMEEAIAELKAGRMIIITDDENRENEGDLVAAGDNISAETINFMVREGRGLVCVSISEERADELGLYPMTAHNTSAHTTAFTITVDAARGTTTGISAQDRALTIRQLADGKYTKQDFVVPGHVFPLRARKGGVLVRAGHTEASLDLLAFAGLKPAGAICEIMNEDGTMARQNDLQVFGHKHGLKIFSVAQLIEYRRKREKLVERITEVDLPTKWGHFRMVGYKSMQDEKVHVALIKGSPEKSGKPALVRVHSECLTGDVFGSQRCDCGDQLHSAMQMIEAEGEGVLVYMQQEGRGIGLEAKLKAYRLQEQGKDTVEANEALGFKDDLREYGLGAQILVDLGITKMRLLTNNPKKVIGLEGFGLEVVERRSILGTVSQYNQKYLETKKQKMGHYL